MMTGLRQKSAVGFFKWIVFAAVLWGVMSCGAPAPKAVKSSQGKAGFTGMASWYGHGFQGRRTASGERFNMHKMTAAHRSLPFGTQLKVTHVQNGKSVRVTVNDRGPFVRGRVLDLSYAAAKKINMLGSGHAMVRARVVN